MAQEHEYICNSCGKPTPRSLLTVKKVLFTSMGAGSTTSRSRVKEWLCVPCVLKDEDWNLPKKMQPSERVPPNEVHFRNPDGSLAGKIVVTDLG